MRPTKILRWIATAILASAMVCTVALGYDETVIEPNEVTSTPDGVKFIVAGDLSEIEQVFWNETDITDALFGEFLGFTLVASSKREFVVMISQRPEYYGLSNSGVLTVYFADGRIAERDIEIVDYRVQVVDSGFEISVTGIGFDEVNSLQWNGNEIYGYVASGVAGFADYSLGGPLGFYINIYRLPWELGLENAGTLVVDYAQGAKLSMPLHFDGNSVSGWSGNDALARNKSSAVAQKALLSTTSASSCPFLPIGKPTSVAQNTNCGYGSTSCKKTGYYHTGIDYSGSGTAVAAALGKVSRVETMSTSDHGMGNNVIVEHTLGDCSKIYSSYSHLAKIDVSLNSTVAMGQKIGSIGGSGYGQTNNWGTHLHFEMKIGNYSGNPVADSTMKGSDGASCGTVNNCWGYVSKWPDSAGWRNPSNYTVPDLVVSAFSASPTTVAPGGSISLSATSKNQGAGASPSTTTLTYRRSTDATITSSDTSVCTDSVAALAAGATEADSCTVSAPTTSGSYYYGACLTSVSGENSTSNNCSAAVKVTVRAQPDLVVSALSGPSSATRGSTMSVSYSIKNQGTASANPNYSRAYLSTNTTITTSDTAIWTCNHSSGIAAGSTRSCSGSPTVPATLSPGTYYLGAIADYSNVIAESNESNNTAYRTITIK